MRTIVVLALLVGCTTTPDAPLVHIIPDSSGMRDEYTAGLLAWSALGFTAGDNGIECPRDWYARGETNCTIVIWISRWPRFVERYGVDGAADRETRGIIVDDRYTGRLLVHLAAHELGHILLDAGHHDERGIMSSLGTTETAASDADYALACESIGVCI